MPLVIITIITVLLSIALASFIGFLCFRVALSLLKDPTKEALKKFKPVGIFPSNKSNLSAQHKKSRKRRVVSN
jgi:hypothetical protein